jgi:hypothetical protein
MPAFLMRAPAEPHRITLRAHDRAPDRPARPKPPRSDSIYSTIASATSLSAIKIEIDRINTENDGQIKRYASKVELVDDEKVLRVIIPDANESMSEVKMKIAPREPIIEGIIYSRKEAASLLGCSTITLCRAYWAGFLKGNKIETNIRHTGKQLLDWLKAGGRTNRAA